MMDGTCLLAVIMALGSGGPSWRSRPSLASHPPFKLDCQQLARGKLFHYLFDAAQVPLDPDGSLLDSHVFQRQGSQPRHYITLDYRDEV